MKHVEDDRDFLLFTEFTTMKQIFTECPHVSTNKKVTGLVAGITASIISLVMKQVELKGVSASGPVSA